MTWRAPPTKVVEARDRLLASSPTFSSLFPVARCHFPKFSVLTDALPAALFQRNPTTYERHAPGESYGKGQVVAVLYFDATIHDIDAAEEYADRIAKEVCEWEHEGLFITACTPSMCSDPSDAQRAAAGDTTNGKSYRTITLLLTWEG